MRKNCCLGAGGVGGTGTGDGDEGKIGHKERFSLYSTTRKRRGSDACKQPTV